MYLLGISAYYHDSAACLLSEGRIIAAAQEERFTRKKHDPCFPAHSIRYCLEAAGIGLSDLEAVVFYEKPFVKFERLLETYLAFAPRGFGSFVKAMPLWLKEKLFLRNTLIRELRTGFGLPVPPILFSEHHEAHAASAFYPSPFREAAVFCLDGVGEWSTTSAWKGTDNLLTPLWELRFPHSLGLLYSAFTYYTGFKVNSGEYKVMGLAPYGNPVYCERIRENLIDIKPDGSFRLNMEYFDYCTGLTMTNAKFEALFGGPPRKPESPITRKEMDLARSIQDVTQDILLRLAGTVAAETRVENLCLAGGVALNCVANGLLHKKNIFKNIWVQPAAGDAGGAVGAALAAWHQYYQKPRIPPLPDGMKGAYLGPEFSDCDIEAFLKEHRIPFQHFADEHLFMRVARELAEEKIIGWFQGKMEFGPRALGARSIIGDARSPKMQSIMNQKIKFRESFRPFAPSVLREKTADYFEFRSDSPYMLFTAAVKPEKRKIDGRADSALGPFALLGIPRSDIPAVTHVDYSARIHTVCEKTNPRYHALLSHFEKLTGCGVIVNTSFNVRGEPIVCSPEDAFRCFLRTEMDTLILGNYVLDKKAQVQMPDDAARPQAFDPD